MHPFEEALRSFRGIAAGLLPEVGLIVGASAVVRLHIDRSLIGLDVRAGRQLAAHHPDYRHQHLSDGHHPAAHRGPADKSRIFKPSRTTWRRSTAGGELRFPPAVNQFRLG